MTFTTVQKSGFSILKALVAAAMLSTLAGCALGNIELSGPANDPNAVTTTAIKGKAIGGQNPLTYAQIDLYAVDNTAYGGSSHLLTNIASGTNEYYPGGALGCDPTALSPTAYVIASGNVTITASNSMIAGQLINVSDAGGSGLNGTYAVTSATGTSFNVTAALSDGAGTTGGTYNPVCYTHPTSNQYGAFSLTSKFTCGAYGSSIAYVQASGGNPGLTTGTSNSSLVITALLQSSATSTTALTCGALSSADYVTINEITTAAMGIAMGQFFTTTYGGAPTADGFGAPNTTQAHTGITNAANTALVLAATNTGNANTSVVSANSPFSVTATPEYLKLQTIADILANCVNGLSANANCTSMFSALSTGTAPTDTLQAAVLFGINPTAGSTTTTTSATNVNTLWSLVAGTSQPWAALSSEPADWSIGIQYTDTNSSCTPPVTGTVGTCALNDPQNAVPDSTGNIWVINHNSSTGASLTELSPVGAPVVTNSIVATRDMAINNPRGLAIDTNDNLWFSLTTSGYLVEYNSAAPGSSASFSTSYTPYGPAIDGNNNVFYGSNSTSAKWSVQEVLGGVESNVVQYPAYCQAGAPYGYTKCTSPTYMAMTSYVAVDTTGIVWLGNADASATDGVNLNLTLATMSGYSATCGTYPCIGTTGGDTITETYAQVVGGTGNVPNLTKSSGMAAGAGGVMWVTNGGSSSGPAGSYTIVKFTNPSNGTAYGSNTSVGIPTTAAVDGAGNAWIGNNLSSAHSVSEFSSSGAILSPINTTVAPFTTAGFQHPQIVTNTSIAVDPSGNVWVANNTAVTGGVFEIVGVAAPTVTPIARALKNGTVGARP